MTWLFTSTVLFLCGDLKLECPFRLLYSYRTLYKNQSHSNFNWLEVVPIIIFLYKLPFSHPSVLQLLDHKAYLSGETTRNDEHGVLHQETSVEMNI